MKVARVNHQYNWDDSRQVIWGRVVAKSLCDDWNSLPHITCEARFLIAEYEHAVHIVFKGPLATHFYANSTIAAIGELVEICGDWQDYDLDPFKNTPQHLPTNSVSGEILEWKGKRWNACGYREYFRPELDPIKRMFVVVV